MLIHFLHAYSRESVIRFHSTHFPGMPPIFHADGIYTRNYCYGFIKKQRFSSHRNGAPFQSFVSNPSLKLALRFVALQSDPAAPSCLQMQVINMSALQGIPISEDHQSPLFREPFLSAFLGLYLWGCYFCSCTKENNYLKWLWCLPSIFFSFFSGNWQAQVRHYTYPQILGCQYSGATESCETIQSFRHLLEVWASLVAQMVQNLPAMWKTLVRTLSWEDALEKEMAIHSSILSWRIPWTEEPGMLQFMGSQRLRHN